MWITSELPVRTTKLTAAAAQVSNVANGAFRSIRLRLMSVTIAITVVTGVMKRNHSAKTSAKFRGTSVECDGQSEMQRGMPKIPIRQANTTKARTKYWLVVEAFLLSLPQ
jgi:DNA/RNA endonuclease YhcR with UshA esterase domain